MDAISKLEVGQIPQFRELTSRRRSFAWTLTILMLAIYYGFIALVAFAPGLIGVSVAGSITLGLVIGILVILSAIVLTGIYVRRANTEFDQLSREIVAFSERQAVSAGGVR